MTRSTPFRFHLPNLAIAILAAAALVFLPQAALAQHGGGGGGGHAGGGGGHVGGGGSGGGHFAGSSGGHSAPAAGSAHMSAPSHFSAPARSAPPLAGFGAGAANSASTSAGANVISHAAPPSSVSVLSNSGVPRGLSMFSEPGPSGSTVGTGGHPNSDARPVTPPHVIIGFPPSSTPAWSSSTPRQGPRTFSGQGGQVWQSPHMGATNGTAAPFSSTRTPGRIMPSPPHIIRGPGGFAPVRREPFFFTPGFGFFGFGFGFDNGFGCDPFWTWGFGCNTFGYFPYSGFGPYGFGYGNYGLGYDYGGYGYSGRYNDNSYGNEGMSQEPTPSTWQNPPEENSNSNIETAAPETVIYLKDGSSFAVKDYWVADGKLHYITSYGGENAVDLDQFDIERTTNENAKQGITITLRPAPESAAPAPDAQPNSPPQPPPATNPAPEGTQR